MRTPVEVTVMVRTTVLRAAVTVEVTPAWVEVAVRVLKKVVRDVHWMPTGYSR